MIVNIALLTVTDTRTFDNDKSGAILVKKIEEANHNLIDRKICKDNKEDIVLKNFSKFIKSSKVKWITYLSSTSVYGDHKGEWVNENSETNPLSNKGLARFFKVIQFIKSAGNSFSSS